MSQLTVPPAAEEVAVVPAGPTRSSSFRRRRKARSFPPLRGLLPLVALLGIWQLVANYHSPFYPPPTRWWRSAEYLWNSGQLLPAVDATLKAFIIALAIATVIGSIIGYTMGTFLHADRALRPTVEFWRAVPGVAVVPVFVLLIGYNLQMKLTVVSFGAMWPVLLATRSGALNSSELLKDVAGTLKLSRWERLRKVALPSMIPAIFLGVHVAAPLTLISTILVEILTGVPGIGSLLSTAQNTFRSGDVYALAMIAGIIGLMVNLVVSLVGGYLTRYRPHA